MTRRAGEENGDGGRRERGETDGQEDGARERGGGRREGWRTGGEAKGRAKVKSGATTRDRFGKRSARECTMLDAQAHGEHRYAAERNTQAP